MVMQSDIEKIRLTLEETDRTSFSRAVEAISSARRVYILEMCIRDSSRGACGQFSAGDHLPADWKWSDHSGPAYCRRYGRLIGVPVLLSPYPPYVGAQCWAGSL